MISMRLSAATAATLFLATAPMQASADTDIQLSVNFGVVYQDEQEGPDASSSADYDFGYGRGLAFSRFGMGFDLPRSHETSAEIILEDTTADRVEARTFVEQNQQWNFSDTNLDRLGTIQMRAHFNVDWNLERNAAGTTFADSYINFVKFDSDSNFQSDVGFFSCSTSGDEPNCSGDGFNLGQLSVSFNGSSWDITGTIELDFEDGEVNSNDNWFGMWTGTSVSMNGGMKGEFMKYGAGNSVEFDLTSTEGSVTVVAVPEPAQTGLQAMAIIVLAAIGRRRLRA